MSRVKTCSHCGQEKPVAAFDPGVFGHPKPYCRACTPVVAAERRKRKSERSREWARANPDKVKQSRQATYEKSRAERLRYMRRWREQNKEHIQEYHREYARGKRRRGQNDQQSAAHK